MSTLTLGISIAASILVIAIAVLASLMRYKYARPKMGMVYLILASATGLIIIFSSYTSYALFLRSCPHPQPPPGSDPAPCVVSGSIAIDGSTALEPLVQDIATQYTTRCPGTTITVKGGGSNMGLNDVEDGVVAIGDSDIYAPSDQADLVDHQVAVVIYTLVANQDTGVHNLTTDQIRNIYSGQYKNWTQVGGKNLPIKTVSRPSGSSGTRKTFDDYILGPNIAEQATINLPNSTDSAAQVVEQTPGAIGYVTIYEVGNLPNLNTVSIDGNPPTLSSVQNNTYHFWNIEHMYTKGEAGDLAAAFINYMGSNAARQTINSDNFVNMSDMESGSLDARCP
ncbi:MAG: substrate-binding domain-containing protein [Chloroflexi bacterium]|nr:substrate-binding domain-containing protein [Chloroflexota bacterium]